MTERDTYRFDDDGPTQTRVWVTHCADCYWEDSEAHETQDECTVTQCPDCGSEHIIDEEEWS